MEPLFISFTREESRRTAVIAEELGSIWLYLSRQGERAPGHDCWLLNTFPPPQHGREFYRQRNSPPPAPADRVIAGGTMRAPAPDRWSVVWSPDGESVAALLDGQTIGFIAAGRKRGNARYIKDGAESWALPWTDDAYCEAFPLPGVSR